MMAKASEKKVLCAYTFLILVAALAPTIFGMTCFIALEISKEREAISDGCGKSNPVNYDKYPGSNTTMEEFDFDDNCNRHCMYKGNDMLTPDGKVKKDQVAIYFKETEFEKDVLVKVTEMWNGCVDAADKIGKEKKLDECKLSELHDFCFSSKLFSEESQKSILKRKCC